jgi:uncharacterized membrane protein HdeD (DUF308 family)
MSAISPPSATASTPRNPWLLMLLLGIAMILLGTYALGHLTRVSLLAVFVLGFFLIGGGVVQLAEAFVSRRFGAIMLHLALAALYIITGIYLVVRTETATAEITLVIAIYLFVTGVFRAVGSVFARFPGWGVAVLSGLVDVVLGILLLSDWPYSGLFFIGLVVAFDLILGGITWVISALAIRSIRTAS